MTKLLVDCKFVKRTNRPLISQPPWRKSLECQFVIYSLLDVSGEFDSRFYNLLFIFVHAIPAAVFRHCYYYQIQTI